MKILFDLDMVKMFKESGFRRSHWRCSIKKAVLKNFAIFTGKHLCWSLFLVKLQAFRPFYRTPMVATSGKSDLEIQKKKKSVFLLLVDIPIVV